MDLALTAQNSNGVHIAFSNAVFRYFSLIFAPAANLTDL
jgi:hypothetical protein